MADVLTTTAGGLSGWVQAAHDRLLRFGLRSEPMFRAIADVEPALVTNPGTTVTFRFMNDLAVITTTLDESTDVDRVDSSESTKSVSVAEYGNAVGTTAKLRATGLMDVDGALMEVISFNLVDSLDGIVRDVLAAGTNVRYSGGKASRATLTPNNVIESADIRYVTAKLRGNKAAPRRSGFYVSYIHPDVSLDLRSEAGTNAAWRESHVYASPDAIYAGEIGAYEGQVFIETPRGKLFTDAGSSPATTDVYATITVGQQALAEAVAIEPHVVQSPVTDRLRRFVSHGWYGMLGWGRFREASLYRTESASSIGS